MGLSDKRAVKAYQENIYPGIKSKVDNAAGFEVCVEVDWDTLAVDELGHLYEEAFAKVYFEPLIGAITAICTDDMGKNAMKEGLKKVVISNKTGNYNSQNFKFEDGALILDHESTTNLDDSEDRKSSIMNLFESNL